MPREERATSAVAEEKCMVESDNDRARRLNANVECSFANRNWQRFSGRRERNMERDRVCGKGRVWERRKKVDGKEGLKAAEKSI